MRLWLALALVALLVLMTVVIACLAWIGLGPLDLPPTAYIALALGVSVTLLLGCGLMALMFYSNRRSYDERADRGIR